uniref:Phospholipase-like protein n=1 Tax=Tanacetum cinerariifolium TaxID=118510 RepID=A0A6L2NGQ7_TANCI|nr:phospholipase-like protein [Tanacetum cinerariifolium]
MTNKVDIENLTIKQYLMLTQEKQTHGMIRTESGARINMMPKSLFKHLKLTNLMKTCMDVKMGDMTKKAQLGIMENIPVQIDKFLFHSNFVVIDTLEVPNETILLGARINMMPKSLFEHLRLTTLMKTCIDVKMGDMTKKARLGIVDNIPVQIDKFLFHFDFVVIDTLEVPNETILLENNDSPALEQRTFYYYEESMGIADFSSGSKENEEGSHFSENVSRWHVCKPVYITFEHRIMTLKLNHKDPYDLHHQSDRPPNDTLRINTYFPDVSQTQLKKSRTRENSFEEWMKIKLGYTNISDSMRSVMFKEWVKEHFNLGVNIRRTRKDPYSRNINLYKDEFDKEIKQLINEYKLKVGMKRYALEEVWEKCEKFHDSTKQWYDEGFEEKELWKNGIEEIDYIPPVAKNETFEVNCYTFKNGKSFISITIQMNDVLPLGRVNGSRFIKKLRRRRTKKEEPLVKHRIRMSLT